MNIDDMVFLINEQTQILQSLIKQIAAMNHALEIDLTYYLETGQQAPQSVIKSRKRAILDTVKLISNWKVASQHLNDTEADFTEDL